MAEPLRTCWTKYTNLFVAALVLALVLVACKPGDPARSTGAYPIDIFQEMHYNQTYKAQEPPRLAPPSDSVPVSGGYIPAGTKAEMKDVANPFASDADLMERGALLFRQNCSMCHGLTGAGDGPVGAKLVSYGGTQPPALTSGRVQALSVGEVYAVLANGLYIGPTLFYMPPFQGLLSEHDRWALAALATADEAPRAAVLAAVNAQDEPTRTLRLLQLRGLID
ncbi:MAG: cytochrome c [Chloroflexota bacterium]